MTYTLGTRPLKQSEERNFQFFNKQQAQQAARAETARTHRKHQAFLTTTYRDLIPCICWTVILALHWRNRKLQTVSRTRP